MLLVRKTALVAACVNGPKLPEWLLWAEAHVWWSLKSKFRPAPENREPFPPQVRNVWAEYSAVKSKSFLAESMLS